MKIKLVHITTVEECECDFTSLWPFLCLFVCVVCAFINPDLAAPSHWKNRSKVLMMTSTATVALTWHFRGNIKNPGNSKWFWSRLVRSFDVIWWLSVVFWIHSLIHIFPFLISMSGRAMLYLQDSVTLQVNK